MICKKCGANSADAGWWREARHGSHAYAVGKKAEEVHLLVSCFPPSAVSSVEVFRKDVLLKHAVLPRRRRAQRYLVPLLVLVMLITAVATAIGLFPRNTTHAATSSWATYLGSNARTGFNAAETTINATTAANLKLLWKVKTLAGTHQ